jgi:ABC-type Fe3+/spermidine/putrescine transport system ATPase subunit
MPERIEIEAVHKRYPGGAEALIDVSLTVEPGQLLVLLGPSGSGKTTLLRSVAGIERITSGAIRIGERLVADGRTHLPPEQRNLAMVFQDYALWPHLVARDNVAFALRRQGMPRAARRTVAAAMLERVGLGALGDRYPNQLSGGEQQRVALARALVGETDLLLCDEPLSNLDADLRERLRIEISRLVRAAGATTIYITHDQAEAFALADMVGVLEHGRMVQLGPPEQIYSSPATAFVARFTGLAGELPVRLLTQRGRGDTVEVAPVGALELARPLHARAGTTVADTREGLLAIRRAAVKICVPSADQHHVLGTVTDVAFRDRGYEHAVDVAGGGTISGVLAAERVMRGETVGLHFEPSGCIVFAHGSEPPPAEPSSDLDVADAISGTPGYVQQ